MSTVSVIIVNYNAGSLLAECVNQVLPQADEVLVVDNGSTDSSLELCQQSLADEPKFRIVRNGSNLGFAAACNVGIRQATGELLLFLNPDCFVGDNALAELMQALNAHSGAGMAGGLLVNPDGSEQGGARRAVPTPWRSFVRAFGLSRFSDRWPKLFFDFHLHKQPLPDHPIEVEAISGACMLIKREVIEQVGLWDEGYFLHCEDLDWCMRFRGHGKAILFVPSARFVHYQGACSTSRPIFVEWHKHRGMIRFYHKFFSRQYPGPLMWLVTMGVWLRFSALVLYRGIRKTAQILGIGRK